MSNYFRIIPRMDIKGSNLIKTIRLEGVKPIGDPREYAKKYYDQGADEIFLIDTVASLYDRNSLFDVIKEISKDVFIPITLAGGLRSLKDIEEALKSGADKVALNTQIHKTPKLINDIVSNFGSQCMVLQVDAKKIRSNEWEPYINGGRERTYKDLFKWVHECTDRGAGEIFLTSIDNEGTKKGLNVELNTKIRSICNVPIISSGGAGNIYDLINAMNSNHSEGVAISNLLHIQNMNIKNIKIQMNISKKNAGTRL